MNDTIEKMSAAWEDAYEKYWAKHWVSDTAPGFKKVLRNSHLAAMRAAVTALADNVTADTAERGLKEFNRASHALLPEDDADILAWKLGLTAALRSLLQKENGNS